MSLSYLKKIDQPATSLKEESGKARSALFLLKAISELLGKNLKIFEQEGFTPFASCFKDVLNNST